MRAEEHDFTPSDGAGSVPTDTLIREFDRDEAVGEAFAGLHEAAQQAEPASSVTRGGLLRRAGLVAGGAVAATLVPATLARARNGGTKANDIKILNYALTLEYLEAAYYAEAVESGALTGSVLYFAMVVSAHETAHVALLQGVLGAKAVAKPTFDFKGTNHKTHSFLATSKVLEDTGVAAYQGQAPLIHQNAVLAPAGGILAVEARHAAWVRDLLGAGKTVKPAPEAFSTPKSMSEVLKAVKATGFIKS